MEKYMPLGAVKVTIQKFYRISGESTQEKGVTPDVVLPSRLDGLESGEKYLDYALGWDQIAAAEYKHWQDSPHNISQLRQKSLERIKQDEEFSEIIAEAEEASLRREKTRQSLVLADMLLEREQNRLSAEGSAPHGAMTAADDDEEEPTLDEEIAEDPYVDEGKALLLNLLAKQS
jgi:carboxyl-terminal processing protease